MGYYRDVYLKSEEWKSLRRQRLVQAKFKCELCGLSPESLDVHHLKYRNLLNSRASDLRALCRNCHDSVHYLMKKYKKLKTLCRSKQWSVLKRHLAKGVPASKLKAVCEWRELSPIRQTNMTRGARLWMAVEDFSKCRNVLVSMKVVKRKRMKWTDELSGIAQYLPIPLQFLNHFMAITGKDPRYRSYRANPQKLLT